MIGCVWFGGTTISAAIGCTSVNNSIIVKKREDVSYSGIVNGEFVDAEEFTIALRVVLRAAIGETKITKLFVGVPTQFCSVFVEETERTFEKPKKLGETDIKGLLATVKGTDVPNFAMISRNAVYYKIDGGRAIIDARGQMASKLECQVCVTLAAESFLKAVAPCLGKWYSKIEFVPQITAEARYLIDEEKRDATCVLVSSQQFYTSVAVVSGDSIVYLRSFNMGLAHVVNDVSVVLAIDYDVAKLIVGEAVLSVAMGDNDNYQISTGEKTRKFAAAKINDIIKCRLNVMSEHILNAVKSADGELLSAEFFICGGFLDSVNGVRDFWSKAIGVQLKQCVDPFTKLNSADEIGIRSLLRLMGA